jgi:predicted transcriptional regulator
MKLVTVNITNLGEIDDIVLLKIESPGDSNYTVGFIDNNLKKIRPGETKIYYFTIKAPNNKKPEITNITLIAISQTALDYGLGIEDRDYLILNLKRDVEKEPPKLPFYYTQTTCLLLVLIIMLGNAMFVTQTEIGKYALFTRIILPLYTRKSKDDLNKDNYKRGLIFGFILGSPGECYTALKRALKLKNGTLTYFLNILEREGAIKSDRDGMYKRFYPTDVEVIGEVLELSEVQKKIYLAINENEGISQKGIAKKMDIAPQVVNYHIKLLEEARVIKVERDGRKTRCFIIKIVEEEMDE